MLLFLSVRHTGEAHEVVFFSPFTPPPTFLHTHIHINTQSKQTVYTEKQGTSVLGCACVHAHNVGKHRKPKMFPRACARLCPSWFRDSSLRFGRVPSAEPTATSPAFPSRRGPLRKSSRAPWETSWLWPRRRPFCLPLIGLAGKARPAAFHARCRSKPAS